MVNLVEVGCSLLSVLVSAFIGEMSQPERHGRKKVLVRLGNLASQDFDVFPHSFCVDTSSPEITTTLGNTF